MVFGPSLYLNDVYVLHSNLQKTHLPLKGVELLMLRDLLVCVTLIGWHMKSHICCYKKHPFKYQTKKHERHFLVKKRRGIFFLYGVNNTSYITRVVSSPVFLTHRKTNMTRENQPFEDVSPIKHGDFPASHVSFRRGKLKGYQNLANLRSPAKS